MHANPAGITLSLSHYEKRYKVQGFTQKEGKQVATTCIVPKLSGGMTRKMGEANNIIANYKVGANT